MIDIYLGSYMYTHRRCTLLDYIDTQRAREMRGAIYDAMEHFIKLMARIIYLRRYLPCIQQRWGLKVNWHIASYSGESSHLPRDDAALLR